MTGFGDPPVGALMAFAGQLGPSDPATANPPATSETAGDQVTNPIEAWGWMLCDGRSLSIYQYPELFAALGYLYGGSDGNFNIPDYRGYFWRGTDAGAGVDKDSATRTDPAGGTATNSGVGSIQPFAVQTHEHTYLAANSTAAPADPGTSASIPPGTDTLTSGGPTSSLSPPGNVHVSQNETRPSNIYVNYIIKFTSGVRTVAW
ncbi:phage tail protein [Nannocystaceae bacterium ST9]